MTKRELEARIEQLESEVRLLKMQVGAQWTIPALQPLPPAPPMPYPQPAVTWTINTDTKQGYTLLQQED